MLLLLSRFSRVLLCATPQTAAHQAPPSLRFSRQEHWSGLPLPSPCNMHKSVLMEKEMATHSSVLAWRISGMGELGGLSSMGLHRVGHD